MAGIQTDDVNAELRSFTVGIAANESESGVIDLKAHRMSCFMVDGWTAAEELLGNYSESAATLRPYECVVLKK